MREVHEQVTISDFKVRIKEYTQDPEIEVVLTRDGKPICVYVGINAWCSTQEALSLLREHPKELLESLVLHQQFQKTGKATGISLKEFEISLKKDN